MRFLGCLSFRSYFGTWNHKLRSHSSTTSLLPHIFRWCPWWGSWLDFLQSLLFTRESEHMVACFSESRNAWAGIFIQVEGEIPTWGQAVRQLWGWEQAEQPWGESFSWYWSNSYFIYNFIWYIEPTLSAFYNNPNHMPLHPMLNSLSSPLYSAWFNFKND